MAKTGLSNQLLGKRICPKPEYGSPTDKNNVNYRVWGDLKPSMRPRPRSPLAHVGSNAGRSRH